MSSFFTPAAVAKLKQALFAPPAVPQAQISLARKLFTADPRFIMSCTSHRQLPESQRTEIAVVGRSNVGKSSLLNALMASDIVRTSATPGHTTTINLFYLGANLALVDLPGYGYRSKEHQMTALGSYLTSRPNLASTCVLIEASHGVKEIDQYTIDALEAHKLPYQIVLTKCDKLSDPLALRRAITDINAYIEAKTTCCHEAPQPVSALQGLGIDALRFLLIANSGYLAKHRNANTANE